MNTWKIVGGGFDSAINTVENQPGRRAIIVTAKLATADVAFTAVPAIGAGIFNVVNNNKNRITTAPADIALSKGSLAAGRAGAVRATLIVKAIDAVTQANISYRGFNRVIQSVFGIKRLSARP